MVVGQQRTTVIEADYPTLLTHLLHYPAPSSTYPFDPALVLSQAIFLRDNITPASGVQVVIQNQDLLGIKAQPPERPVDHDERPVRRAGPARGRVPISHNLTQQQQQRPGVQGFAQGWLDRAQAAGLDKAVLSAVSDLRVGHHCPLASQPSSTADEFKAQLTRFFCGIFVPSQPAFLASVTLDPRWIILVYPDVGFRVAQSCWLLSPECSIADLCPRNGIGTERCQHWPRRSAGTTQRARTAVGRIAAGHDWNGQSHDDPPLSSRLGDREWRRTPQGTGADT